MPEPGRASSSGPTGGGAALYGLIHQLVASVAMLVRAQFGADGATVDPDTIIAVLEPASGGDLHLAGRRRRVLQFKHRKRPLAIGDIVKDVLPDLFRAHCDQSADAYELHTTNGVSRPGLALVADLKDHALAQAAVCVAQVLDEQVAAALTALRAVFAKRGGAAADFEASFATFVTRVSIAPAVDADHARGAALAFLRHRVAHAETVEARLDELVGYLARQAAANNARITVDDILHRLGLPGTAAGHSNANGARLAAFLAAALRDRPFNPDHDVRPAIQIDLDAPLSLVVGKSGCGKSWALYRLAAEMARDGRPAVLVRAADLGEFERALKRAIRTEALQLEAEIDASLLGQVWRRIQASPNAVITILWEGCRDPEILDAIRVGGFGPGLHIVAEYPVAHEERLRDFGHVPIHAVDEFTPSQLFAALQRRGLSAGHIPQMIRRMLRLPVLCGIYATLALEQHDWDPQTEYRVLEDFWLRARKHAGKLAGTRLVGIARKLIERGQTSLTDDDVHAIGLDEPQLESLVAAGWLSDAGGRWSFAHDRLLTWALAVMHACDFEAGQLSADALAARVIRLEKSDDTDKSGLTGLGFLLMDVVWLIANVAGRAAETATFLQHFESEDRTGARTLYGELLPTVGPRALAPLEERAQRIASMDDLVCGNLVAAFRGLPLTPVEQAALCDRLWTAALPAGRSIAISLGRLWPLTAHRDALWAAYCALDGQNTTRSDHDLFERMRQAINLLARSDPAWLAGLIVDADVPASLRLAAYVLKELDHDAGAPIWRSARAKLVQALLDDTIAMQCAGRFGDAADLDWLVPCVAQLGWCGAYALTALVDLDPERALAVIATHPPHESLPYNRYWLDRLLDHDFARTAAVLRDWMIAHDSTGGALARLWQQAEDRVDATTIDFLLDRLDHAAADDPDAVGPLAVLLGSPTLESSHDALFHARRDTPLAERLARRARAHFDGTHDPDHVAVRRIVRRIGGAEYEALILHALSPDALDAAHTGIAMSIVMPSPAVVLRLAWLVADGIRGETDKALLLLWRTLLNIDPATWRPRLLALLDSDPELDVLLALHLLPEYAEKGDATYVHAAFARADPAGAVAERAMVVACTIGEPSDAMVERAVAQIRGKPLNSASLGCLNVLLNAKSDEARIVLDVYLAQLETARSWASIDSETLACRLWRDDAPANLWRAADRMLPRRGFFGDHFTSLILERDVSRGMDALLESAFAPPDMFVRAQPEAIELIASVDKALATQAFVHSWNDFEKRREHLAPAAHGLEDEALETMIASLHEEYRPGGPTIAYREICIILRRTRDRSWPLLLAHFRAGTPLVREALAPALGWVAESSDVLIGLAAAECDLPVLRELDEVRRSWARVETAVTRFRADPTFDALEQLIEIADPKPLCAWADPLRVIETIQADSRLTGYAEIALARRSNAVGNSKFERVIIRREVDED